MEFEKLDICPPKNPALLVKVKEAGNVVEVQYMSCRNNRQTIQMLSGGKQYMVCSTGEVCDCVKHKTRADQKKNILRTFAKLRDLINANVTDVSKVRWITLTYAENMTDTERLYDDFKKFNMRFQYFCKKNGYGKPEYIVVMEPQARGAWHAHLLYIFDSPAPFIPNSDLAEIWGYGFVKIKALDNVDNVGAYLTAYLGDMELSECTLHDSTEANVLEKDVLSDDGTIQKKRIVKGARLPLYPAKFNIYRCSRGVKKPTSEMMSQSEADKMVSGSALTYEKTVKLTDSENNFESIINTRFYNKLRRNSNYDPTAKF